MRNRRNILQDRELERKRAPAEEKNKRLREFLYTQCPKCGMELSEPTMLRKQIVADLLVPTLVFEETATLYQETFKTGVDVQLGCS